MPVSWICYAYPSHLTAALTAALWGCLLQHAAVLRTVSSNPRVQRHHHTCASIPCHAMPCSCVDCHPWRGSLHSCCTLPGPHSMETAQLTRATHESFILPGSRHHEGKHRRNLLEGCIAGALHIHTDELHGRHVLQHAGVVGAVGRGDHHHLHTASGKAGEGHRNKPCGTAQHTPLSRAQTNCIIGPAVAEMGIPGVFPAVSCVAYPRCSRTCTTELFLSGAAKHASTKMPCLTVS